ncbi:hypothetical protein MKX08_003195 [Trichoderma sp. CBMAI-0020]|nr:hypothetical protein MKX08_003195 [Trichoderma sp. CBMAI-0020]
MDIDAINYRRFNGTYNACGKKGHKEVDCRSKMTCGFCGKKGHNETHCYTKKNIPLWKYYTTTLARQLIIIIYVLYTKAVRKDQIWTRTRTASTIESMSHNTNAKLKFLNFKTSITITPMALETPTTNAIDA